MLRSIFIALYLVLLAVASGRATWHLLQGPQTIDWIQWLLSAPVLLFFLLATAFKPWPRTDRWLWPVSLPVLVGAYPLLTGHGNVQSQAEAALAWSLLAGYGLYLFWYSQRPSPLRPRLVGKPLPEKPLYGASGEPVLPSQMVGQPTVWLWVRGNWCPFCVAQAADWASREDDWRDLGARVCVVSPQPQDKMQRLARRLGSSMVFLEDRGASLARALGIAVPYGIPMGLQWAGYDSTSVEPTVVVTDDQGKVVWWQCSGNYRCRPGPDLILQVLRWLNNGRQGPLPNQVSAYWNGRLIARSTRGVMLEGNHYFPRDDVQDSCLEPSPTKTVCPWKGVASYFDVVVDGKRLQDAAWCYRHPSPLARQIKDHIAFWRGVDVRSE